MDFSKTTFLPAREVWQRYGRTDRTLDRWLKDERLGFPKPMKINGRRYFSEDDIVEWERQRAAQSGAA